MNSFQKTLIIQFGAPILRSVVQAMLNDVKLTEYRDAAFDFMRRTARKTETEFDDMLVEHAISFIMEPGTYIKYGHNMIDVAILYVENSATEWDDFAFLPILNRLKNVVIALDS